MATTPTTSELLSLTYACWDAQLALDEPDYASLYQQMGVIARATSAYLGHEPEFWVRYGRVTFALLETLQTSQSSDAARLLKEVFDYCLQALNCDVNHFEANLLMVALFHEAIDRSRNPATKQSFLEDASIYQTRATVVNPTHWQVLFYYARTQYLMWHDGDLRERYTGEPVPLGEIIQRVEAAAKERPDNFKVAVFRAKLYFEEGDIEKAKELAEAALELPRHGQREESIAGWLMRSLNVERGL